jgi:membrane fusion protein, multidrug efflux system
MIKRLIIVGVIIAAFLGGISYLQFVFKPKMIAKVVATMQGGAPAVTAEPARIEDWTATVQAIGTMMATKGVHVAPEIDGLVTGYFFDSGQDVTKGQRLVQLDDSVQQAQLLADEAKLKQAQLDYDRQKKLVTTQAVSQATLDSATATRDADIAAVKQTKAIIAQKDVKAPFSGRLGLRNVERGQYVSVGQGLVWLQALDPIWIDFPVSESDAGKIALNDAVTVTTDMYPGKTFKGHVIALDARVAADTRTRMVRALLPNPDKMLLPGMFGNVAISAGGPHRVVTVPRTAVTYSLYGDSVWVVESKKTKPAAEASAGGAATQKPQLVAVRRFVRVGETQGDRVAILTGVKAGEQVITSGQLKLQPDSPVTVNNAGRLKAPPELPRS